MTENIFDAKRAFKLACHNNRVFENKIKEDILNKIMAAAENGEYMLEVELTPGTLFSHLSKDFMWENIQEYFKDLDFEVTSEENNEGHELMVFSWADFVEDGDDCKKTL